MSKNKNSLRNSLVIRSHVHVYETLICQDFAFSTWRYLGKTGNFVGFSIEIIGKTPETSTIPHASYIEDNSNWAFNNTLVGRGGGE